MEAGAQVVVAARGSPLGPNDLEEALGLQVAIDLSDADGAGSWLLVKGNQAISHHGSIGCPWRVGVGQPVDPGCHFLSEGFQFLDESQEPVGELNGVGASGSCCSSKAGRDGLHIVLCDANRNGCGKIRIGLKGPIGIAD